MIPDHPGGDPEVPRGPKKQKKRKKIPDNPDFPDLDPDFRISVHGVAMGASKATCSQNFKALATIVPEMLRRITIIKYRIFHRKYALTMNDYLN